MTCSAEETVTEISDVPCDLEGLTLWGSVLNNDTDNFTVVNDDSTSLESGTTKEIMGVKDETGSGTESSSIICDYKCQLFVLNNQAEERTELDGRGLFALLVVLGEEILPPCLHDKHVVDGNNVDLLDTLALEFCVLVDVTGNLVGTRWGEAVSSAPLGGKGTCDSRGGNGDDDVLAGQLGEVDLLLQGVDLDLNIGYGVSDLDRGSSDEGGESLVGSLSGSGE
jgi:hypothetical protein